MPLRTSFDINTLLRRPMTASLDDDAETAEQEAATKVEDDLQQAAAATEPDTIAETDTDDIMAQLRAAMQEKPEEDMSTLKKVMLGLSALTAAFGKTQPLEMMVATEIGKNKARKAAMNERFSKLMSMGNLQAMMENARTGQMRAATSELRRRYTKMGNSLVDITDPTNPKTIWTAPKDFEFTTEKGLIIAKDPATGETRNVTPDQLQKWAEEKRGEERDLSEAELKLRKQRIEESKKRMKKIDADIDKIISEMNTPRLKPLVSTEIRDIADLKSALLSLNELAIDLDEAGWWASGPVVGTLLQNIPGTDARALRAQVDLIRQRVGKALEGGVLRKEDESKYQKILPNVSDDARTVRAKLDILNETLSRDLQVYMQELRNQGKAVDVGTGSGGTDDGVFTKQDFINAYLAGDTDTLLENDITQEDINNYEKNEQAPERLPDGGE